MKLEKAIEIKARTGEEFLNTDPDEIEEADRLSIEALKRVQDCRQVICDFAPEPLPGETKEEETKRR